MGTCLSVILEAVQNPAVVEAVGVGQCCQEQQNYSFHTQLLMDCLFIIQKVKKMIYLQHRSSYNIFNIQILHCLPFIDIIAFEDQILSMIVLSSRQLLIPSSPISLPMPEFLYPPKGALGAKTLQQFLKMVPALNRLVMYSASWRFSLITPAPSPYSLSFARAITSSTSSNLNTHCTGPKISSRAITMSSRTLVKTVGSTKKPRSPYRLPPVMIVAPYSTPFWIYPNTRSICFRLIWGPCSAQGSSADPNLMLRARLTDSSTKRSQREEWTKTRVPAMQTCPALKKVPQVASLTAFVRSAWRVMMFADFPPSSRVTRFRLLAWEFRMISSPTFSDPVKATLSTSRCLARWAPASPNPETMLTTPGGKPASLISSATRRAERGVCSAVFMTTVQPAARAGASLQACMMRGTFHGMICPATPTGSFLVERLKGPSMLIVLPRILSTQPAQQRQMRGVMLRSRALARLQGLPLLTAQTLARLSAFASIRSASLKRQPARSVGSMRLHGPLSKASLAQTTAKSMSFSDPRCTSARMDQSAGFVSLKVSPRMEFTNLPLMKCCVISLRLGRLIKKNLIWLKKKYQQLLHLLIQIDD